MKTSKTLIVASLALPAIALGQQNHNSANNQKPDEHTPQIMLISQMDNRKIYHWANGQRSTPTGRQAAEPPIKWVKVIGDSAVVLTDYDPQQNNSRNSVVKGGRGGGK